MFTQMLNQIPFVVSESIHFRTRAKHFLNKEQFWDSWKGLFTKSHQMQCNHTKCGYLVKQSMAGILQQQKQSVNTQRFGDKYDRASLRREINILKKKSASICFHLKGLQMRHCFPLSNSPAQQFKKKLVQETHINLHFYQVYYQLQV